MWKRWWIASVGVAAVLLMAAVLGVYWPGGFVVLGWLDLSGLFGAAAMGMLALAWWLWFRAVDHPLGKRMRAPSAEQRNQWWIALVALAALLIMVTVLGVWRPGTLVVLGWPVLLGTVPDAELPSWYAAADVLAFPSTKEGWGLAVLEAMSAGLPVVASDLPVCLPTASRPSRRFTSAS